jgi:YD repeat-containing protein
MAKIENAGFKSVLAEEGHPCTYSSKTLYNSLKALVPDALITTYTHKPLVGIKQQTDPSGVTIYYDYDSFGRLSTIKNDDADESLLKSYEYHYAN